MKFNQEIHRVFRQDFPEILPNAIWKNDDGTYEVFGRYRICPERTGFRVFCAATEVGVFSSTRTAMSWCVADKFQDYNLARELYDLDVKLSNMTNDIITRANIGDRSKTPEFKEHIVTKLETKIIRKKEVENRLSKCVSYAKYYQQRGFNNETVRTGRNPSNKASR